MMVLRDLRMRQAAADLLSGNISLEQVIRNTGYASSGSFSRAFKQAYGVDPSAYRKSAEDHKSAEVAFSTTDHRAILAMAGD